jgi:hypothetical protein
MNQIRVVVESGEKRAFASAVDWPGWSRSGRDEESALQALLTYGPRYAKVVQIAELEFQPPSDTPVFVVTERLQGNATTDFGAPGMIADAEKGSIDGSESERLSALLKGCWDAYDNAVQQATGKELRKGPRGGGRDLEKIQEHVIGANQGYLRSLGWKPEIASQRNSEEEFRQIREEILSALEAAAKGELPEQGPRGGKRWPPRYFVRRVAWHVLDHVWEIEDRILPSDGLQA